MLLNNNGIKIRIFKFKIRHKIRHNVKFDSLKLNQLISRANDQCKHCITFCSNAFSDFPNAFKKLWFQISISSITFEFWDKTFIETPSSRILHCNNANCIFYLVKTLTYIDEAMTVMIINLWQIFQQLKRNNQWKLWSSPAFLNRRVATR